MNPLYAAISFPHLAIDDLCRQAPGTLALVALLRGSPGREVVVAVSDDAADCGIHVGQRRAAAEVLCPGLKLLSYDDAGAARTAEQLACWAYGYTSQVCSQWPGTLVLEIGRSLTLHGGWAALQARLRADLDQLGFRRTIAVAPTMRGARVLSLRDDGKAVTTLAGLQQALRTLPVTDACLPGDAGARLASMGISTLGAVARIDAAGLQRRFGAELGRELAWMFGIEPEVARYYVAPPGFDQTVEMGFEVDQIEPLLFALRRLTGDLSVFLSSRDAAVSTFTLRLEHSTPSPDTDVVVGMLAAEQRADALFELGRGHLERTVLAAPVTAMRLQASQIATHRPQARDLFDTRPAGAMDWPQLRERLVLRLGQGSVLQLEPAPDWRPEAAWRARTHADGSAHADPAQPRPLWLLPTPQRLPRPPQVMCGPERIESGWWDGEVVRRDYYHVRTHDERIAWAFTEPGNAEAWHVHGWF